MCRKHSGDIKMIIDGRKMAAEVLARAKARAATLSHPPRVLAIVANETPATKSYLAIKAKRAADAGCGLEIKQLDVSRGIHNSVLSAQIVASAKDFDAVIVQLPLPEGVDTKVVCDAIPAEKDADVLSSAARAQFEMMDLRSPSLLPPVVGAVKEILEFGNIEIKGKTAVVVGKGFLVGAPVATWLAREGAHVMVLTRTSEDFAAVLRTADIIVSGAGSPHLITPEMLKDGVVLIDAGTSESNGTIAGDADPACAPRCSLFTPVPGGVGPLAVACLFDNAATLAERAS